MTIRTHDCFDCYARDAALALVDVPEVYRDHASSGHQYKTRLYETFGTGGTILSAQRMLPRNPASVVNPLYLANEIYLYVTSDTHPPIFNYWPWERVKDYYASPSGVVRPYGYGYYTRNDRLVQLIETLRSHPTTKRAVVSFYPPEFLIPSADTPCTLYTQYRIIEGEVCTATAFRSHDYYGGFRTDPLRISFVQQLVAAALRTMDAPGRVGSLTQFDGSLHYYPDKPHTDLAKFANYQHDDQSVANWCPFDADYTYLQEVLNDLDMYLAVVADADTSAACVIKSPSLRKHAYEVLDYIAKARVKYPALKQPA